MGTKPSSKGSAPGAPFPRAQFFSNAGFVSPDLFSSPEMPLFRSAASRTCRQRQENSKRKKSAKTSRRRNLLGRHTLSTAFDLADLLDACLGNSPVYVETSLVKKQPLHLHLLQSMDPKSFMIRIYARSITTHPIATLRVEGAHASDVDGTLEGHDHDV